MEFEVDYKYSTEKHRSFEEITKFNRAEFAFHFGFNSMMEH